MFNSVGKTITLTFLAKDKTAPVIKGITGAIAGMLAASAATAAEAIKVSAEYQKTKNSLEVYTGSLRRTNAELAEITELARNTQGLSLPDAEKGTLRLRALGFEAKTARDLVAGTAKNKVLSGSDESAVNRVIQNLEQLKAGSPQIKKDIQQMVLAIPTLSKVINETFGSVEKFQAALRKNPDEALTRFAEAAKNTKVGNAGLSDSIIRLENEFTVAQRLFGEPLLEPVTDSVKLLTKYLEDNKESWSNWGNFVANIIASVNTLDTSGVPKPPSYKTVGEVQDAYNAGQIGFGDYVGKSGYLTLAELSKIGGGIGFAGYLLGEADKKGAEVRKSKKASDFMKNRDPLNFAGNVGDLLMQSGGKTQSETAADAKAALDKLNEEKERARRDDLASLKRNADSAAAIVKNRYDTEQALLDLNIRYTDEQESNYIKRSAQIKQNFYTSERARIEGYYSKLVALSGEGSDEALKAEADKQKELANLNSKEVQDAYKSQRQILELEQKIQNERRQNDIKFNQIRISEIQQGSAKQLFEIQKGLERGVIGYETYFGRQKEIAADSLKTLLELNRKNLDLELQDKTLTFEEIRNLRKESALEELRITQEYSERTYQIEKDAIERRKDLLNDYFQGVQQTLESRRTAFDLLNSLTFGDKSTGRGSDRFLQSYEGDQNAQIKNVLNRIENLGQQNQNLRQLLADKANGDQGAGDTLQKILDAKGIINPPTVSAGIGVIIRDNEILNEKYIEQRVAIIRVRDELAPTIDIMKRLRASYDGTAEGVDRLRESILKEQQANERAQLAEQIKLQQEIVDKYANDEGQKLKENLKLTQLKQAYTNLGLKQLDEQNEIYKKSIVGLRDYNQALREGDAQAVGFVRNAAIKSILEEQGALLESNIVLQERIKVVGEDSAARFQNAWLGSILAVKEANIQAVESQIQSQVKLADAATIHTDQIRAKVLSHLAEQQNINDAFASGIVSAVEKVNGILDKNLNKLGDVPILGDLLKFGNRQLTTNITTNLLDKFFPSEFVDAFTKPQNPISAPIVEQQKKTNQILAAIAGRSGVSSSVGATNSGGDFWTLAAQILSGGGNVTSGQVYGSGQNPNNPLIFHNNSNGGSSRAFGSAPEEIARQLRLRQAGEDYPDNGRGGRQSGTTTALTTIGSLAAIAGGLVGGRAGGFLSNIGGGIATGAQLGSLVPGIGTVVGAVAGGAFGLIRSLFGGDPNKKKDKKENLPALQKAFSDAFADYRQLITDVRSLRENPDGALSKGDELRQIVASGGGIQFLSKKYKKESQNLIKQKLDEIDKPSGLRDQLQQAVEISKAAGERANRLLPEFATGGLVSSFMKNAVGSGFFSGLVPGMYDRKDDKLIKVTGREVVLTPDQWMPITPYLRQKKVPGFANGGFVGGQGISAPVNNFTLELHNVNLTPDSKAYLRTDDGERRVIEIMKKAGGNGQFVKGDIKQT